MMSQNCSMYVLNFGQEIKAKFGLKQLETSFHGMTQSKYQHLEPFKRDSRVSQTDRQTDGRTDAALNQMRRQKLELDYIRRLILGWQLLSLIATKSLTDLLQVFQIRLACLLEERFDGQFLDVFDDTEASSFDAADELCLLVNQLCQSHFAFSAHQRLVDLSHLLLSPFCQPHVSKLVSKNIQKPVEVPQPKTPCCTPRKLHSSTCMCYQKRSYCRSKFYIARIGIFDLFCSHDLQLDPMTFIQAFFQLMEDGGQVSRAYTRSHFFLTL